MLVLGPQCDDHPRVTTLVVPCDGAGLLPAAVDVVRSWLDSISRVDVVVVAVGAPDSWPPASDEPDRDEADRAVATLVADGIDATLVRRTDVEAGEAVLQACPPGRAVAVIASPRRVGDRTHWPSTARRLIRQAPFPVLVVPAELDPGRLLRH